MIRPGAGSEAGVRLALTTIPSTSPPAANARAGRIVLVDAAAELLGFIAREGTRAAAEGCWCPGQRLTVEEIRVKLEQLRDEVWRLALPCRVGDKLPLRQQAHP
jgi:hypothetical protein